MLQSEKRSIGVSVGGDAVMVCKYVVDCDVNQIGWYRLRAIVASTTCSVYLWVFGYRTIVHDMWVGLRISIESSMWVTKVNIVIRCWIESTGKVIVSPLSSWCDIVRIMHCCLSCLDG